MAPSADNKWLTWYAQFNENHGFQRRQEWYSDSTMAYRWARPRYPDKLITQVLDQAHLSKQSSLLEIGCGPGIATAALAEKGLRIVAIEPSNAACELARKSCRNYNSITIVNSTFEQYDLNQPTQQQYDAVLAATSFHWISPDVACSKSAAALKPGGSLILLWATPPQPSAELSDYLQPVYDRHNLSGLSEGQRRSGAYYKGNFDHLANTINQSGFFQPSNIDIETCHSTYSIEKYLALLSTLSPYIAVEEQRREHLLSALGARLADALDTGSLETTHWFGAQVALLQASA
ncbi:MAG: class I SAM-dependent methyltransferase [Cyanobacteria bacterium P01_D01_bin.105]